MKELIKILSCPICNNKISLNGDKLVCIDCNISFNINDGIPNMLPPFLEEDIQKTITLWESLTAYPDVLSRIYESYPDYLTIIDKPLIDHLKGKVLEVGCGTARLRKPIEKKNCEYFGLDPTLSLLSHGNKNGADNLVCGVGEYLPFQKNSFDSIIGGYHSFRYIDLEKGLRECSRVLKPDGLLIFSLWNVWYLYLWLFTNILVRGLRNYGLLLNVSPLNKNFIHNDVFWIYRELNKLQASGFEVKSIITSKKLPFLKKEVKLKGYWKGKKGSLIGRDIIFICGKVSDNFID